MTTWSACMFSFELDVLEIRLATLDPVVDRHIIVEAPVTHTGAEKPMVFAENRDRYAKWAHKIEHLIDESPPGGQWAPDQPRAFCENDSDHWRREHHQRDMLSLALRDVADDDLVLLSDCDEIPDPQRAWETGERLAREGRIAQPVLAMHVGRLGLRWPVAVPGTRTRFLTGSTLAQFDYSADQATNGHTVVFGNENGNMAAGVGWHLAYMGGVDAVQRKLAAFAHQELNRPPFNTPTHIQHCLDTGVDLFDRPGVGCVECPRAEFPVCALDDGMRHLW